MVHKKKKKSSLRLRIQGYPQRETNVFLYSLVPATVNLLLSLSIVHTLTQYSCILTSQVSTKFDVSEKIINNSDNFRIKCLSDSKISAILCVL